MKLLFILTLLVLMPAKLSTDNILAKRIDKLESNPEYSPYINPEFMKSEVQDRLFLEVADILEIKIDPGIPRPKVRISELVKTNVYSEICSYCNNIRINFYVPERNEIWLRSDSTSDVLVHELVHYFQYYYLGVKSKEAMSSDYVELQAAQIQNMYKLN